MALSVLLMVSLALTAASAAPQQRIVGGAPTAIEEFPYIVALTYTYAPGVTVQRCVGCLLSSWHVLTTAYCFTGANENNMLVRAGSTNSLSGGSVVPLARVTKHPDYIEQPLRSDIAVLQLATPLSLTGSIGILYLPPPGNYIPDGTETRVVSWGFESMEGPQLQSLKSINLFKVGLAECQAVYADKPESAEINERVICANAPGKGMCRGDAGAPMVIDQVIVGISSYFYECGNDEIPDVFTRVDPYTPWILEVATAPNADGVPVKTAAVRLGI